MGTGLSKYLSPVALFMISASLVLCIVALFFYSDSIQAGVIGSKHDLSVSGASAAAVTGVSTTQVCVFCHHPHRNDGLGVGAGNDLLWNMNVPAASYGVYQQTATMNAVPAALTQAAPQSFTCMSCHNGSFAGQVLAKGVVDDNLNVGTAFGIANVADLTEAGSELQNDHPINFDYDAAAGGIKARSGLSVIGAKDATNIYPLYMIGGQATMQCSTCHDVHGGDTSQDANIQFLRGNTAASEICYDCHTNK